MANPILYREVSKMKTTYRFCSIFLLSVFLFAATVLSAQQTGITGRVTDSQGAVISDAAVEVKQVGAGLFHTKTNAAGTYLIPSLAAGDYIVTVRAPGFSTVETKVSMLVGQTPEIDVTLPIKGVSDAVIVRADNNAINTTSSTVADNITPDDVKSLPINGRNYMELATLL